MTLARWKGSGRAWDLAYRRGGELFGQPPPTGAINPKYVNVCNPLTRDMQIMCRMAINDGLECLGENIGCFSSSHGSEPRRIPMRLPCIREKSSPHSRGASGPGMHSSTTRTKSLD
jgi:hypothetical protein